MEDFYWSFIGFWAECTCNHSIFRIGTTTCCLWNIPDITLLFLHFLIAIKSIHINVFLNKNHTVQLTIFCNRNRCETKKSILSIDQYSFQTDKTSCVLSSCLVLNSDNRRNCMSHLFVLSYSGSSKHSQLHCQKMSDSVFRSEKFAIYFWFQKRPNKEEERARQVLLTSYQELVCKCLILALELCGWRLYFDSADFVYHFWANFY